MPHPIIHINGFPGTGKLTIARKLVALLGAQNGKLVHNHLLIDPAGAILPRTSSDYQPLRRAIRTAIFDTLATSQDTFDSIFVFTDFQSDDAIGRGVMEEYRAMASRRGCAFVPITVTCSMEENMRRLVSTERTQHGKLTDAELMAHVRDTSIIHQTPEDHWGMELNLTELDADMAAAMLYKHVAEIISTVNRHRLILGKIEKRLLVSSQGARISLQCAYPRAMRFHHLMG